MTRHVKSSHDATKTGAVSARVAIADGTVTAIGIDGAERVLLTGDAVYPGDLIRTGTNGRVVVETDQVSTLELGPDSQILFEPEQPATDDGASGEDFSVQAIQQAILAGADPTEVAPPPGAGGAPDGGGHSAVRVARTAGRATPDSGFETTGLQVQFDERDDRTRGLDSDASQAIDGAVEPTAPPPIDVPLVSITLLALAPDVDAVPGQWVVQEDSLLTQSANTLTIAAEAAPGSSLTQIVVSGFNPTWSLDLSALNTSGATATLNTAGDTITVSGLSGNRYAGELRIAPPADSDLDLGAVTAIVSASTASGASATDTAVLSVVTDANADSVSVDLSVTDRDGDATDSFAPGDSATARVTATFGDNSDGSESHTVTVSVPIGFSVDAVSGGGSFDAATRAIRWTINSDGSVGGAFDETFEITNESAALGAAAFSANARAMETTTGDVEPDAGEADNVASATARVDVVVVNAPIAGDVSGEVTESALDLAGSEEDGSGNDPGQPAINTIARDALTAEFGEISAVSYLSGPGGGAMDTSTASTFVLNASDGSWTLSVDRATKQYQFTLNDNVDHTIVDSAFGNDRLAVVFQYTVEGTGGATTGSLTVNIRDDQPEVPNLTNSGVDRASANSNIVLIVDRSGSMNDDSGVPGFASRFDLAREALNQLLDSYDVLGDVNVRIVDFAGSARISPWFDGDAAVPDASEYLDDLSASGGTDYTDALRIARGAFDDATPSLEPGLDYQRLVYFISDGKPTNGGSPGDNSIPDADISAWQSFLQTQGFARAFAVGVGAGIGAADSDLEDVAWPNDDPSNPIIVESDDQLASELLVTIATPIEGNVPGTLEFTPGADDGGFIQSITVDATRYVLNRVTQEVRADGVVVGTAGVVIIATALGGRFEFDFNSGDYAYQPPRLGVSARESFTYTFVDGDGDTASAALELTITPATFPAEARPDTIVTNIIDARPIDIPAWTLLHNDVASNADPLTVSELIPMPGQGSASFDDGNVAYTAPAVGSFTGSFDYRANDSEATPVTVIGRPEATLSGSEAREILVGGDSNDTIRSAGPGDILVGGNGNDDLIGEGGGNNILAGGPGADEYIDGAGTQNVIRLSAEDVGTGVDVAYGFDNNPNPQFGDKIDISDVLDSLEDLGLFSGDRSNVDDVAQVVDVSRQGRDVSIKLDLSASGTFGDTSEVLRLSASDHPLHSGSNIAGPGRGANYVGTDLAQMLADGVLVTS